MAKTISIKTIDGNRNNFSADSFDLESKAGINWLGFEIEKGMKYFNVQNVVSVTIKDEDE